MFSRCHLKKNYTNFLEGKLLREVQVTRCLTLAVKGFKDVTLEKKLKKYRIIKVI